MSSDEPPRAPAVVLCPGCCTIDSVLAVEHDEAGPLPQVACARCAFTFPVLPVAAAGLTLRAMREHDCLILGERGNWAAVGREINKEISRKMRMKIFSWELLAQRLRELQQEAGEEPGLPQDGPNTLPIRRSAYVHRGRMHDKKTA